MVGAEYEGSGPEQRRRGADLNMLAVKKKGGDTSTWWGWGVDRFEHEGGQKTKDGGNSTWMDDERRCRRMPQLPTPGPRADAGRYLCLGCGGKLRWTELPHTPSAPLRSRRRTKRNWSDPPQPMNMGSSHTRTHT